MIKLHWNWLGIGAVTGIYTWSYFLPATRTWYDFSLVLTGWEAFRLGTKGTCLPVWLANPLFFLAVVLLIAGYNRAALIFGAMASLDAGLLLTTYQDQYAGYYLWLTSMLLLTLVAGRLRRFPDRKRELNGAGPRGLVFPDPSVYTLFNQPQTELSTSTEIHPGPPPDDRPSPQLQLPRLCSPSSST